MEYRVKKYNGISPGTFYALTDNEARDSGTIDFPLWIVNLDTGIITEIGKGFASFMPGWEGEVEYKISKTFSYLCYDTCIKINNP
jgi:hypothetical protein